MRYSQLKPQAVVAALKASGAQSAKWTKRNARVGYQAKQVNPFVVAVMADARTEVGVIGSNEHALQSADEFAQVLSAAGFEVNRPYDDKSILAVRKPLSEGHMKSFTQYITESSDTWRNEQGHEEGKCACGDLCNTGPHASDTLHYCGDCGDVVCACCVMATEHGGELCKRCQKRYEKNELHRI